VYGHPLLKRPIPVRYLPVMKKHCKTCPFKPDSRGVWNDPELAAVVTERTLFKGQQICHGTEGKEREPNHRCKGSFDYNGMLYERLGFDIKLLVK